MKPGIATASVSETKLPTKVKFFVWLLHEKIANLGLQMLRFATLPFLTPTSQE
jgi:hypothetical protein